MDYYKKSYRWMVDELHGVSYLKNLLLATTRAEVYALL